MDGTKLNEAKVQEFGVRALNILNHASLALMMSVGHRTGLFEAMADLPPSTARQIADAARLQERYVREWVGAMVTGGVVDYDDESGTYQLPPGHAAFLTKAAQTKNIASFAEVISPFREC